MNPAIGSWRCILKTIKNLFLCALFFALVQNGLGRNEKGKLSDKSIFTDTMVEMTWEEIKKEADEGAVVLFPIAVIEEHGPHMNLGPDIYLTCLDCQLLKQRLEKKGIRALIAPVYYWGMNSDKDIGKFPGTFTVRPETFKAILKDNMECLKWWGFKMIFCVNLHGDPKHRSVLDSSIDEIRNTMGIGVYDVETLNVKVANPPSYLPPRKEKFRPDYHAGADETALMWEFFPDKVDTARAKRLKPQSSRDFEPLGYVGDPASFELEKNAKADFLIMVQRTALAIETFLKQTKMDRQ